MLIVVPEGGQGAEGGSGGKIDSIAYRKDYVAYCFRYIIISRADTIESASVVVVVVEI